MKRFTGLVFVHVLLPLIAGAIIYLLLRQDTFLHQLFFSGSGSKAIAISKNLVTDIFVYNLPDFCWCYSFASALFIWERWQGNKIKFFSVVVLSVLVIGELIQIFLSSFFTFDWGDIVAAIIAFGLSYYQISKDEKEKK